MGSVTATWRRTPSDLRLGLVALVAGLFINFEYWSSSTRNGVVVDCAYLGFGEVIGGAIATVVGLRVALQAWRTDQEARPVQLSGPQLLAAAVAVSLLGLVLVAKGLGLIFSPCG